MHGLRRILLLLLGSGLLLAALACGSSNNEERPEGTPGPGPGWAPQEAIAQITELPRLAKDGGWNAEFDPYQGRWRVELVYQVRNFYPPREDRREVAWYVYEATGEVVGPLD